MMSIRRKGRPAQKGVAMIETALTLPLILLVLFGIINFGVALYNKSVITNASREAARNGIVYSSSAGNLNSIATFAQSRCVNRLINFGGGTTCTATVSTVQTPNPIDPTKNDRTLVVRVNYDFNTIAGALLGIGQVMNLESETQMKFEI